MVPISVRFLINIAELQKIIYVSFSRLAPLPLASRGQSRLGLALSTYVGRISSSVDRAFLLGQQYFPPHQTYFHPSFSISLDQEGAPEIT